MKLSFLKLVHVMYGESNILLGWYRGLSKEVLLNSGILNLLVHTLGVIPSAKIRMGERGKSTFCQVERRKIEKREVWKKEQCDPTNQRLIVNVCIWKLESWNEIPIKQSVPLNLLQSLHVLHGYEAPSVKPTTLGRQPWKTWCHHGRQPSFLRPLESHQLAKYGSLGPLKCEWQTH